VTSGTLSNPRLDDDNDGRQIAGRVAWHPAVGLTLGASGARGAFVTRDIVNAYEEALGPHDYTQEAVGVDGEYSRGYWIVRGEAILSRWTIPKINMPFIDRPLGARTGTSKDGTASVRASSRPPARRAVLHRITGSGCSAASPPVGRARHAHRAGRRRQPPAQPHRAAVVQHNWRDGGRVQQRTYVSGAALLLVLMRALPCRRGRLLASRPPCRFRLRGPRSRRGGACPATREARGAGASAGASTSVSGRRPISGRPRVARHGQPARRAGSPPQRRHTSRPRPRGAFEAPSDRHARMDQRNERFIPHVLAITAGTWVDFPNGDRTYHKRLLALEDEGVQPGALRRRTLRVGQVRSGGHRARVLRDPFALERVTSSTLRTVSSR
jgi:hypothetical protein